MKLVVNGADVEVDDRHAKTPLLWALRDVLGLHGTKFGCGAGFCAACIVSGPVTLTDVDGRVIEHPDPMSMCRCGGSSNKPFCDGTHATIDSDGTLAN
jgi:hypothetical protein